MAENLVRAAGLTKRYGEHRALDRVDLTVRRGEVYGFLGPNGAGKTTTLRILLGLVRPSAGEVEVLGAAPGDPRALARVGALLDSGAFYPYLSGRDNLGALARYCRVPVTRADEVLEIVGLTARGGARFGTYSLGMRQRLGMAAALLKDPDLLVLDEPTNGLDPAGIAHMRGLIRRLGRDGRTVLLSSHHLGEVEQVCDRVGMIAGGRLVRAGTVEELRGGSTLTVDAEPLDHARKVLESLVGADRVSPGPGAGGGPAVLRIRADPDDAVRINRALVLAGIAVRSLTRIDRSLEEIFLETTGPRAVDR